MNTVVGTLLLVQVWSVAPTPSTIGDTVVLEREIEVADTTASLRLTPLEGSLLVEPLAGPEAITASDGFIVRYVVALFEAGDHTIPMPDIELVYPTGRLETRVVGEAFVTVLSVLPPGESLPAPRASREPIPRNVFSDGAGNTLGGGSGGVDGRMGIDAKKVSGAPGLGRRWEGCRRRFPSRISLDSCGRAESSSHGDDA